MSSNFCITTFKKIRSQKYPQKHYSTIGLIVDCTKPYRKDVKRDYCMRLKIIDPTLNGNQSLTVFLFSKHINDFATNVAIGDILFLKHYLFEVNGDKISCKKSFKISESIFIFFPGKPSQNDYHQMNEYAWKTDEKSVIIHCIGCLRRYSKNYFKAYKVPLFGKGGQSSDFDAILKVTKSEKVSNDAYRITLKDSTQQIFKMLYCTSIKNGVYKVRSIANLQLNRNQCYLIGNDYTNFLEIDDWMRSYSKKEWQKLPVQKYITIIQIIEHDKLTTNIFYQQGSQITQITKLRDLIKKEYHTQLVKVRCEFVQVFTPFDKALKKFDQFNLIQYEYQREQGQYIYNVHFAITDQSLDNEVYHIYLYTHDTKGSEFFLGLNVNGIFGKNILDYRQKYVHIVNRLLEETDYYTSPLDIILSPMNNGKQTIYRIVNTQLIL